MIIIFNRTGEYVGLSSDSCGIPGFIEKKIETLPGPPERCVWIGDMDTGNLVTIDSKEYKVFESQQSHYDDKVRIYESEHRHSCSDKIVREGYDVHDQLNIIRHALSKISDDEKLIRMEKVIDNITNSYRQQKHKYLTDSNFEYVTIQQEEEEQY